MKSIVQTSGLTITETEKKDSIKPTNGRLPCRNIIFHSIEWNYFVTASLEKSIRKFMRTTISRAIEAQCNSIAFPAIGRSQSFLYYYVFILI